MDRDEQFHDFAVAASPGLHRLALSLTSDPHRAQDAVQSTLERVYLAWPRATIRDPAAYARTVLVRQVVTERRHVWWRREVTMGAVPEVAVSDDSTEDRHVLVAALALLPARQRATVVLRYLEDLSVAEVADLLGCAEGTVKRAAHDGLRSLRSTLTAIDAEGA